jgi:hypothetical protein
MLQCRAIVEAGRVKGRAAFDRVTADADTTKRLLESTRAKIDWFNAA